MNRLLVLNMLSFFTLYILMLSVSGIAFASTIVITDIDFIITDMQGNTVGSYGYSFQKDDIRYISPRIIYISGSPSHSRDFDVKIIKSDGTLMTSSSSPIGYSYSIQVDIPADKRDEKLRLTGWGNDSGSAYVTGSYTWEIWSSGQRLIGKQIEVLEKPTTPAIILRNETNFTLLEFYMRSTGSLNWVKYAFPGSVKRNTAQSITLISSFTSGRYDVHVRTRPVDGSISYSKNDLQITSGSSITFTERDRDNGSTIKAIPETGGRVRVTSASEYYFTPNATGRWIFNTSNIGGSDPILTLLNSDRSQISQDDDGGGTSNSIISQHLIANTLYIIRAGFHNNGSGSYDLNISRQTQSTPTTTFIITYLDFAITDMQGAILGSYGYSFRKCDIKYISPRITYNSESPSHLRDFNIKIIKPDGCLMTGVTSPSGFTYSINKDIPADKRGEKLLLSGWGNESGDTYSSGVYTCEVWSDNQLLVKKQFTVHYQSATPSITFINETNFTILEFFLRSAGSSNWIKYTYPGSTLRNTSQRVQLPSNFAFGRYDIQVRTRPVDGSINYTKNDIQISSESTIYFTERDRDIVSEDR